MASLFYPIKSSTILRLPSVACFALLSIYIVQFSRCNFRPFSRPDRNICFQVLRSSFEPSAHLKFFLPTFSFKKKWVVGPSGLEPPTSRLSVVRSSQLSYGPASSQSPLRSKPLFSDSSLCSLAPPFPFKPTSLGFERGPESVYPLN